MKYILLFISFTLIQLTVRSQNLILNPSFEQFPCNFNGAQTLYHFCDWYKPSNDYGTPDGFENDSNGVGNNFPCQRKAGQNTFAGYAYTPFGDHFLGMLMYYPQGGQVNSRENFTTKLISPLDSGKLYKVGFHVKYGNRSKYFINHIGLALSPDTLVCGPNHHLISLNPTLESPFAISDSVGWTRLETLYLANGGESFLTLGNFIPDSLLQINLNPLYDPADTTCQLARFAAYYFFDSIYVLEAQIPDMIADPEVDLVKNVYPNPVTEGIININMKDSWINPKIEIYSITGSKLLFETETNNLHVIKIKLHSNYTGFAIIKITNETPEIYKIIIK